MATAEELSSSPSSPLPKVMKVPRASSGTHSHGPALSSQTVHVTVADRSVWWLNVAEYYLHTRQSRNEEEEKQEVCNAKYTAISTTAVFLFRSECLERLVGIELELKPQLEPSGLPLADPDSRWCSLQLFNPAHTFYTSKLSKHQIAVN
ncbi:hypothetical protein EON65_20750 [archaeon]|nr:MAG: hypothetical protein EON65_20750 [archaeon]